MIAAAASCVLYACLSVVAKAGQVKIRITDGTGEPIGEAVVALLAANGPVLSPPLHQEASIDQVNKTFRPHVLAIEVGTLLTFPNSDNIRHEVYSFSEAKRFETKLYAGTSAQPVLFDRPGVVVLGCNIHDSMRAYVYVVATPYFSTTDAAGHGTIEAPPGQYTLEIWHPRHAKGRASANSTYEITSGDQDLQATLNLDRGEE